MQRKRATAAYGKELGVLPPEHDDEEAASSSTVPLATLRRMIDEQEATEIDLPMLPQDYVFDDD